MQADRIKITALYFLVTIFIFISSYHFGVYSYQTKLWPFDLPYKPINISASSQKHKIGIYDNFGRLIDYPGKQSIKCPKQDKDTAVILAIGQSNISNSGWHKFTSQHTESVVNYFDGKCYIAASPLLGAQGEMGEFITPLADRLIENGTYKAVIIISSGIGGTSIFRWQRDGDLNEMLLKTIRKIREKYKITEIIWHQGETDFALHTTTKNYEKAFKSLEETLLENKVNAPIFISIATKCGSTNWTKDNPTSLGQQHLIHGKKIMLGVDTDAILTTNDRRFDKCHFTESGQLKTAASFANAIEKYHSESQR